MAPDIEQLFGLKVRELRLALGLTQAEFAARLTDAGITAEGRVFTQQQVAKLEAATRPIRLNEAARIAAVFQVGLTDLLGEGSGAPSGTTDQEELLVAYFDAQLMKERDDLQLYAQVLEQLGSVTTKLRERERAM